MPPTIPHNPELQLAANFVQNTGCNIFLTGKAGTGKTTFLHRLKKNTEKRLIVTAPTGVAAINAGGVTLHSFFQLPFGPFIPGSQTTEANRQRLFRFSKEKIRIIKSLDLLIIDEISMVRADLLDAVDAVLRRHRRNDQPFGGVQLLMIGDLHQLSPVAKPSEWQLLQPYYASVYFFSSHALGQTQFHTIELTHIFRQSDVNFIQLLNRVRDNRLDAPSAALLNQRYIQDFTPDDDQGYITLTTHNKNADVMNLTRLGALTGKQYSFKAEISGDFPEYIFPTPGILLLKEGAQVMFLRNDASGEKQYYNGKIGRIKHISNQNIRILCPGDSDEILVAPVEWENIRYTLNPENQEVEQEVIGKFKQYPLKLAWAITIHKSQGLTFEKAVIDAKSAFAHGQVYVALSRCKTLGGMVLSAPIPPQGIETDEAVLDFTEKIRQNRPSKTLLGAAETDYQQHLLLECFDFNFLHNRLNYLTRLLQTNAKLVQISGLTDINRIKESAEKNIFRVGENFGHQLKTLFKVDRLPGSDPHVLERLGKASAWFQDQFAQNFDGIVQTLHLETDNRELGKKLSTALENLKKEIAIKRAGIKCCENQFSPGNYLRAISQAEINLIPEKVQKSQTPAYSESDIEHPELFGRLKDWRSRKAAEEGLAHFQVLHQRVLIQIGVCLPDTETDLAKIPGVGKKTLEKYGGELLEMVAAHRKNHGIKTVILPLSRALPQKKDSRPKKAATKTASGNTRQISFDLFNKGMSPQEIAKERGLVESTIQSHLCFFIKTGQLDINKLLSPEKQQAIGEKLTSASHHSLTQIKKELGNDYAYGDIKLMIAHQHSSDIRSGLRGENAKKQI
ncbi:MAG: helix-turn-helix domain-containing protein [Proteobacteria bacterium]|nr:helix-turn-helix domain-containing protein [Pseudomonadota bacterium]